MKTKPNVLWYCSDQQRYDTINILGNKFMRQQEAEDRGIQKYVRF